MQQSSSCSGERKKMSSAKKMDLQMWNISLHNLCTSISSIHNVIVVCSIRYYYFFFFSFSQFLWISAFPLFSFIKHSKRNNKIDVTVFIASNHHRDNLKCISVILCRSISNDFLYQISEMKSGSTKILTDIPAN